MRHPCRHRVGRRRELARAKKLATDSLQASAAVPVITRPSDSAAPGGARTGTTTDKPESTT
ncbi:hypothetical protein [Derxia gummosa]|uniref:Uncharacterized protein n=1 Tax=Derxia gummosa DSM 723 TaxID=1121388 RepID=A0A8B6X7I2_9BURK|nr:hypothetical protein [Derxia gummosa]